MCNYLFIIQNIVSCWTVVHFVLQGCYWCVECCCCNDWAFNSSSTWSDELGWLLEWKVCVGHFSLVCYSSGNGRAAHWPRDCVMDVKLSCKGSSVFLIELACSIWCSSGLLFLYSLSICKPNCTCWSSILGVSCHAPSSWCSCYTLSTCSDVQFKSLWSTNTL